MDDLIKTVATFFEVDISQMTGKRRNRQIVRPRQVCMWLARELMGSTLEEIGNCFGGRDHTTVLYAFNKIEAEMESDPTLKQQVEEIRKRITTK
jgi:chromosomal replication initiator protein